MFNRIYYILRGYFIEHTYLDIIHDQHGILRHYSNRCYYNLFPLDGNKFVFTISYEDIGRYCKIYD